MNLRKYQKIISHLDSLFQGFETCVTQDLSIKKNGKDYLRACLETLAQLHGTGLCYKNSIGGNVGVLKTFPNIEEQVQVKVNHGLKIFLIVLGVGTFKLRLGKQEKMRFFG